MSKAHALAQNLKPHMTNPARLRAIAAPFTRTLVSPAGVSVLIVGIDNNAGRQEAAAWGRIHAIPVVFAMLSRDGLRVQAFLQRPNSTCLSCVLPDLEVDIAMPCAAASMASCMLAASHALELTVAVMVGNSSVPTWRETSLDGSTERTGTPQTRSTCPACRGCARI